MYLDRTIFFLSLWVLTLSGCGGTYQIESPATGSIHANPPPQFAIGYMERPNPSELPTILLNGQDVTDQFNFGETVATASGNQLKNFLIEGTNLLAVKVTNGPQVGFTYDTRAPEAFIVRAERVNGIRVEGRVLDSVSVNSLFVNDLQVVNIDKKGNFSVHLDEEETYTITATDILGHTSSREYGNYNLLTNQEVIADLSDAGLNSISADITSRLKTVDATEKVAGTNVYNKVVLGLGAELNMTSLVFSLQQSPPLTLNATNQGIQVNGVFVDSEVGLQGKAIIPLVPDPSINATALIDRVEFSGLTSIGVNAQGDPEFLLQSLAMDISGVTLDLGIDAIESLIQPIISAIVNLLENSINHKVAEVFNEKLAEEFNGIIPKDYDVEINGKTLTVNMALNELVAKDSGVKIELGTSVKANSKAVTLGPINTKAALPTNSNGSEVGLTVSSNLINQAINAAYLTDLIKLTVKDENGSIGIESSTSPYIKFNGNSTELSLVGLIITSRDKKNNVIFTAQANLIVDVKIKINNDNSLAVIFNKPPEVDVFSASLFNSIPLPVEFIDIAVTQAMPILIEKLTEDLSSIKLPNIGFYQFAPNSFQDVNGHLSIRGDIEAL